MESKIVIYIFSEYSEFGSFSDSKLPFVKHVKNLSFESIRINMFAACGGVKILDYYSDSKTHVRISFWKSEDGYSKWEKESAEIINYRSEYHKKNNIRYELVGPFEAHEYF